MSLKLNSDEEAALEANFVTHALQLEASSPSRKIHKNDNSDEQFPLSQQSKASIEHELEKMMESEGFGPGLQSPTKATHPDNKENQNENQNGEIKHGVEAPKETEQVSVQGPSFVDTSKEMAKLSGNPMIAVSADRDPKIVKSIAESFMFESECFDILFNEEGDEKIAAILDAMNSDSFSTAFSGVEASATGMNMLRHAWCKKLDIPFVRQPVDYQIEWNKDCIAELLPDCKLHDTCLFTNIASFYRDELKDTIDHLVQHPHMAVEVLAPLIAERKAMKTHAWCVTHGKECQVRPCRRHIAGTSCKPWSRKGSGLGSEDPEILFTLAWVGMRVSLEDAEILSENVKSIGSSVTTLAESSKPREVNDVGLGNLFLRLLGPLYHMETIVLSPYMIGDPFNRDREFVKMVHKQKVTMVVSPLSRFCKRFFRICQWSWKSAFENEC